jgi:CHAD domain-containing protein
MDLRADRRLSGQLPVQCATEFAPGKQPAMLETGKGLALRQPHQQRAGCRGAQHGNGDGNLRCPGDRWLQAFALDVSCADLRQVDDLCRPRIQSSGRRHRRRRGARKLIRKFHADMIRAGPAQGKGSITNYWGCTKAVPCLSIGRQMSVQQLRSEHSGTSEVQRLACGSMARARRMLGGATLTDDSVHKARKEIRKSRAAVRLLRKVIGASRFKQENGRLRDVGRALNDARDARVLVLTLESLQQRHLRLARDPAATALSLALRRQQSAARQTLNQAGSPIDLARRTLQQTEASAHRWSVGTGDWSKLGPAFRRIYAAARESARKSRRRPDDTRLHEWRKRIKNLRHALQMFEPLQPIKLSKLARRARRLADRLGSAHDLALLRESALSQPQAEDGNADNRQLLGTIDRRLRKLRREAFTLSDRLFVRSPASMDHRLRRYWHRWRADAS